MTLTAIVLAGGLSSRMGQDKALILIEGIPLLHRVCEVALQCASTVYVVTPWPKRYQGVLPPNCHLVQEQMLPVDVQPHGPLAGFAQGLAQVKTDWVLLLACDLPQLQALELQNWAAQLSQVPEEAIAFLPKQAKGWEPLCGFYRQRCLPALDAFIQEGGRSFQRWLEKNCVAEVAIADPTVLFNCNTPQDLENFQVDNARSN